MSKIKFLLLCLALLLPTFAVGQTKIVAVGSLPATCKPGSSTTPADVVAYVSGGVTTIEICSATNTWTPVGPLLAPTVAAPAPANTNATLAPSSNGNAVVGWTQNGNGSWDTWIGIDTYCNDTNGPPCISGVANSAGTPTFYKRTWFNDSKTSPPSGKNAFVDIFHTFGVQTSILNQDRGLFVYTQTPAGDTGNHYGLEGLQSELDVNGAPVFTGSPDSEAAAGSFQLADTHTNTPGPPNFGYAGIRSTYFRESGAGSFSSCSGFPCMAAGRFQYVNLQSTASNTNAAAAITALAQDSTGTGTAIQGFGIYVGSPGVTRFGTSNYGLYLENFGSNSADYNIDSASSAAEQGRVYLEGKTYLDHIQTGGPNRSVAAPTCSSTGTGTSPSCSVDTGSNDSFGIITVTAGTTPGSSGTITLTYNATYGTNGTVCIVTPSNAGTGSWNARISLIDGTTSTSSAVFNFDNNAVNLTGASTYKVAYHCFAR